MAAQKPAIQIPFYTSGPYKGLAGYPDGYWPMEWRENCVFMDRLIFDGFQRGRSAAHAVFKSTTSGDRYEMFLRDLEDVLRVGGIEKLGYLTTYFTFVKRGMNYGIKLATVPDEK
jgi:hypothetical protein